MAKLARCNAHVIRDQRFHTDVDALSQVLEKVLDSPAQTHPVKPAVKEERRIPLNRDRELSVITVFVSHSAQQRVG
jgi:hypothetical protein